MIGIVIGIGFLLICTNAAPISPTMEDSDLVNIFINGSDLTIVGEEGDYFEGDMLLTAAQKRAVSMAMRERNGLRGGAQRWPNRTVVYHIEDDNFDETQVELIMKGMADISNKSCITFRHRNEEDDHYVTIKNEFFQRGMDFQEQNVFRIPRTYYPRELEKFILYNRGSGIGCFSSVGFQNPNSESDGEQMINLSKGCFKHGTVVHEMLHTIGFYHMQSTYDRDDFVKIVWENIREGMEHNFAKYNNDTITDFGVPYDYGSVMHYPETAFSKNGNKTIIPLQENVIIGQRNGMSESDILKLNKMYCVPSDD